MRRLVISLVVAASFTVLTYLSLHYLYTTERIRFDVGDSQGHGPDYGGAEWRGAVRAGIPKRCLFYGSLAGVLAFSVTFRSLRPHEPVAQAPF